MNWKLILLLVLVGVVMAVLSVYGIVQSSYELILWIIFGIVSSYMIAKKGGATPFLEGATVGVLSGILNSVIQSALFDKYLLNNPESLEGFKQIPLNTDPQYIVLFAGPIIGLIYGIIVGIFAMSLRKVISVND
jgi:hypothetical protein